MRRFMIILTLLVTMLSANMLVQAQDEPVVHVVQSGENLFRIAIRYGVSVNAIALNFKRDAASTSDATLGTPRRRE